MLGRFRMYDYQIPVQIGGVIIYPGDILFGDIDGVLVIPREIAYEVLIRTEKIADNEEEIKMNIRNGMTPSEVVRNGGYF